MNPEIRIGDAEREAAVSALGDHYAAGRLTKDEYDERAEQAWAARTSSALAPLFVDLPAPHGNRATAPAVTSRGATPVARREARRGWPGLPLLPVLLVVVGVAMLVHVPWPFLLLLGWLLWRGFLFRAFRGRWPHHPGASQRRR